MYCPGCGVGFDDTDHFCRGCGKKLAAVIAKPRRYGADPPTNAALRSIGKGVAADIKVKRTQNLFGLMGALVVLFVALPVMIGRGVPVPVAVILFLFLIGGLFYQFWEFQQYDDAHRRIEMAEEEVDGEVHDALERAGVVPRPDK